MKPIAYTLAVLLGLLGILYVAGSQGSVARIVVGIVFFAAAGALVCLAWMRPARHESTIVHQVDLSGNVNLQDLTCRQCGANLSEKSVSVKAGAVFVNCEYCGASYQLEEDPQW